LKAAVPIAGGCVCGAVRYECSVKPLAMLACHCRTCQMTSGGAYMPIVLFPASAFKFTRGAPRYHTTDKLNGEKHRRGFCAECGSRLTGAETEGKEPRWIGVAAASLDEPGLFRSSADIFTSHAQAWDVMDAALPKHPEYPPR
jgi:hypothetical protein